MAQQDTQAAGSGTDQGAIEALRNRAVTGLLFNAGRSFASAGEIGFNFWSGYLKALQDVRSGAGGTLAHLDAISPSGYEPPSHFKAAFAALAERAETLTFTEVQQLLASKAVQVAADAVANGKINAVDQLEDSEGVSVNLDDEHAAAVVDGNDGSGHGDASLRATVAQQGGAA